MIKIFISDKIEFEKFNLRLLINTELKKYSILITGNEEKEKIQHINSETYNLTDYNEMEINNTINNFIKNRGISEIEENTLKTLHKSLNNKIKNNNTFTKEYKNFNSNFKRIINECIKKLDTTDNFEKSNTNTTIKEKIENFLVDHYEDKINSIVLKSNTNKKYYSLVIDYEELTEKNNLLSDYILTNPEEAIKLFNKAITNIRKDKKDNVILNVRFTNFDNEIQLRNINSTMLDTLIKTKAIVKNVYQSKLLLNEAFFKCKSCMKTEKIKQNNRELKKIIYPSICPKCGENTFEFIENKSNFIDFQKLTIQEKLEETDGARPKQFDVYVYNDLVDKITAGNEISITGFVKIAEKEKLTDIYIEANNIETTETELKDIKLTNEEIEKFKNISNKKDCLKTLIKSFASDIIIDDEIKLGLLCALVGGVNPSINERDTIHILIIGDPSAGKTRLKKETQKISYKYITVYGSGATANGLTASVIQDKNGEWNIEAGALALANNGVLFLDEFDKLAREEQGKLNNILEDGELTINKAGINTQLEANPTLIAIANPKNKRFDQYKSIKEQLNMNEDVLSRFDLIFIVEDKVDKEKDSLIANSIINKFKEENNEIECTTEVLKKYIAYAKLNYNPRFNIDEKLQEYLNSFYIQARNYNEDKTIMSYDARSFNSIFKLAGAIAKLKFKEEVTKEDFETAINLQKYQIRNFGIDPDDKENINIDIASGVEKTKKEKERDLIINILKNQNGFIEKEKLVNIIIDQFGVSERTAKRRIEELNNDNTLYQVGNILKLN